MRPGAYYRALVANHMGIRPCEGWTLDLGAGDGTLFGGAQTVRLDLAPRHGFVCGDGTALPFRRQAFETVIALDVLEHVRDDGLLLSELARVSGGRAWIGVPSAEMRLFPGFLTRVAHRGWGHVRPGYRRAEVEQWGAVIRWNEPAYRVLYPAIRVLGWLWPPFSCWLIQLAFGFDKRHTEGDQGHYFCRIRTL